MKYPTQATTPAKPMRAAGVGLSVARNAAIATRATMVWRMGAGVNVRRAYYARMITTVPSAALRSSIRIASSCAWMQPWLTAPIAPKWIAT